MFTKDESNSCNKLWMFARNRNIKKLQQGLTRNPIIKEFTKIAKNNPDTSFQQIFSYLRKTLEFTYRIHINLACIEKDFVDSEIILGVIKELNLEVNYKIVNRLRPYLLIPNVSKFAPILDAPKEKRNFDPGYPFWVENRLSRNPDFDYEIQPEVIETKHEDLMPIGRLNRQVTFQSV